MRNLSSLFHWVRVFFGALTVCFVATGALAQTQADEMARVRQALHDAELAEIAGEYQRAWDILIVADAITSEWSQADTIEHWQVYEAFSGVYNVFENYRLAKNHAGYALTGLQERFPGSETAAELALSARWELMLAHFRTDDCGTVARLAEPMVRTPEATPFHIRATGLAAICLGRIGSARAAAALAEAVALQGIEKALSDADMGQLLAENLRAMTAGGVPSGIRASAATDLATYARSTAIAPHDRVFFFQTAGLAIAEEDPQTAGAYFVEAGRLLRPSEADGKLYLQNLTYQAWAMAESGETRRGMTLLRSGIAQFDTMPGALQAEVALTEYALGRLFDRLGDRASAQDVYRAAYARARRILPIDAPPVLTLRRAIDTRDAGFVTFALADEFGSVALIRGEVTDMERRPDAAVASANATVEQAEALLSLFLAGRYADMRAAIPAGPEQPMLEALSHALLGEQALALARLADAESATLLDPGPGETWELGQGAPATFFDGPASTSTPPWLRDLTLAIALQWGTTDRLEEGHDATTRLLAQAISLPEDVGAVVLGLEIYYLYITENDADQHQAIRAWRNGYDAARSKTAWDAFAAMLVLEAAYDVFDEADAADLQTALLTDLATRPDLRFARDFLIFVGHYNGITAQVDEAALIELGVLVPRLLAAVPTWHRITSTTNLSYATALWAQGREAEALDLYRTALDAYELNIHARRDTLLALRSAYALALYRTGAYDQATLLSQSAYAPLEWGIAEMRPSMVMQVVSAHAFILEDRTSARAATEVMRPFAEDPAFLTRLGPLDTFYLMTDYAVYAAGNQHETTALKALSQADATLARADDLGPDILAEVFLRRAQVRAALGNDAMAYEHMTTALAYLDEARAETARLRQTGVALVRPQDRAYAMAFATYAYDYAARFD